MGAEIVWPPSPAEGGPVRRGALRFGPFFRRSEQRDDYDGCGTVDDYGDRCVIGPVAGSFTERDWTDILEACAGWGFKRAEFERHGMTFEVDLTVRPFKQRRVRG